MPRKIHKEQDFILESEFRGQQTVRISVDSNLSMAKKKGVAVKKYVEDGGKLRGLDLQGTDFSGIDIDWDGQDVKNTNLNGIDFGGVNLTGATYNGFPMTMEPISLVGLRHKGREYKVTIFDTHAKINCVFLPFQELADLTDKEVNQIDPDNHDLEWWTTHKEIIFQLIEANREFRRA